MDARLNKLADKDTRLKKRVMKGLNAYNMSHAGPFRITRLNIEARDKKGKLIGGLVGGSLWGWLHIQLLWVEKYSRNKSIGSALIGKAEAEARRRKCRYCHLDTFSFQAPQFYRKMGYRKFGLLKDFPKGASRYYFFKVLK